MMTEKERGVVDRPEFPSFWEVTCSSESNNRSVCYDIWKNLVNNYVLTDTVIRSPACTLILQFQFLAEYLLT